MPAPVESTHRMGCEGHQVRCNPKEPYAVLGVPPEYLVEAVEVLRDRLDQSLLRVGCQPERPARRAADAAVDAGIADPHVRGRNFVTGPADEARIPIEARTGGVSASGFVIQSSFVLRTLSSPPSAGVRDIQERFRVWLEQHLLRKVGLVEPDNPRADNSYRHRQWHLPRAVALQ
jgi:hypothetical protein